LNCANKNTPNKSMDVRAKQLLCYLACLLNSELRSGGFAPRHLSRSASALKIEPARKINGKPLYFSCAV